MTRVYSRRMFLGSALSAVAAVAEAGAPTVSLRPVLRPETLGNRARPVARDAQSLVQAAELGGTVGYAVVDLKSGRELEALNGSRGLPPASVTKAVTAMYALDALGANFRFRTKLIATGPISNGVINGDLILSGGGDPTLDTNALAGMAANLKAAGIRAVTGRFRVFGDALPNASVIDASQPEHVSYNPALSGLNLNFNRVHFQWVRAGNGYTVTMDARSDKYRPEVRVARMQIADRKVPVYTYRNGGDHDQWTVARGALGKSGTRWLPVRHPEIYAAEVFETFARSQGIKLRRGKALKTAPRGTELVTHRSAALSVIIQGMLKHSTNITAELVGMTASVKRQGKVASLAGSAREMTGWAQRELGLTGAKFVDHSGLGDASRITAASLARALARAQSNGVIRPLLKPIPMRSKDGKVDKSHPVKVQAKTGTLLFVSALAGYARAPDGTELAFAFFAANEGKRSRVDRSSGENVPGSRSWNKRAKRLQQALIERWAATYGG